MATMVGLGLVYGPWLTLPGVVVAAFAVWGWLTQLDAPRGQLIDGVGSRPPRCAEVWSAPADVERGRQDENRDRGVPIPPKPTHQASHPGPSLLRCWRLKRRASQHSGPLKGVAR